jgi:hypothetical protein
MDTYTYVDGEMIQESPVNGIDPVDFIKPDPSLTKRETRAYILKELRNWLCGLRMTHAVDQLIKEDVSIDSLREDVEAGNCPAGRMYMLLKRLDPTLAGIWGTKDIGYLCYSICAAYLVDKKIFMAEDIQDLVLGFIKTDLLSSGKVIESFWDHSPFDPLREAPPLSEEDDEDEEDEDEEDENEDEEDEDEDESDAESESEDVQKPDLDLTHACLVAIMSLFFFNLGLMFLLVAGAR